MIEKLTMSVDIDRILQECHSIIDLHGWGKMNQIGLNRRAGAVNPWHDAAGSLYDRNSKDFVANEYDFNEWNLGEDSYIKQQILLLQSVHSFKLGRVRIMRLHPHTGLSVHCDREFRYHMVLKTNPHAYFAFNDSVNSGKFSHVPKDSCWYKVDTTLTHWVYNGGSEERIHLVVCGG